MFGHRPDGKRVKSKSGLYLLIPHIMNKRVDSMNFVEFNVDLEPLDKFIKEQAELTGKVYSYMEILLASIIRVIHMRPDLNRFVVNRRIYQRDGIWFSIALQKSLKKGFESNETTLKFRFEGYENIDEISNKFRDGVRDSRTAKTATDKLSDTLAKIPYPLMKLIVTFLKIFDRYGLLGKKILLSQPFHTTFFITDMRSIGGPSIYHHVYEFGTTGLFFSTGHEKLAPYEGENGTIVHKKVMTVKLTTDERFCDGYYFSKSLKLLQRILKNPKVLLNELEKPVVLTKKEKRQQKRLERKTKKENK